MNYNDGNVYEINDIDDKVKASKDFSEGDPKLEEMLLKAWDLGFTTNACCAHQGYVLFTVKDFENKLGGLFDLVKDGSAHMYCDVIKAEGEQCFKISIHKETSNRTKVENIFPDVQKKLQEGKPFLQGLKEFNPDLYSYLMKLNKYTDNEGKYFERPEGLILSIWKDGISCCEESMEDKSGWVVNSKDPILKELGDLIKQDRQKRLVKQNKPTMTM